LDTFCYVLSIEFEGRAAGRAQPGGSDLRPRTDHLARKAARGRKRATSAGQATLCPRPCGSAPRQKKRRRLP
jgi:hypothetical protein